MTRVRLTTHQHPEGDVSIVAMTVRTYLAGQALAGILSGDTLTGPDEAAVVALEYADALLDAMQRQEEA